MPSFVVELILLVYFKKTDFYKCENSKHSKAQTLEFAAAFEDLGVNKLWWMIIKKFFGVKKLISIINLLRARE